MFSVKVKEYAQGNVVIREMYLLFLWIFPLYIYKKSSTNIAALQQYNRVETKNKETTKSVKEEENKKRTEKRDRNGNIINPIKGFYYED